MRRSRRCSTPRPALLDSAAEIALGLYWDCASIARHAPIALFVDDAQWADRESLKVLAQLARRTRTLPLLVVVATRPHEHEALFAAVADDVRLERRLTRSEADSAWAGLQTGGLDADLCAVLARSALLHDARSVKALRTLIRTDRVAEAARAASPASATGRAASRLAAELALRARAPGRRGARSPRAQAARVLVDALIGRGATGEARAALERRTLRRPGCCWPRATSAAPPKPRARTAGATPRSARRTRPTAPGAPRSRSPSRTAASSKRPRPWRTTRSRSRVPSAPDPARPRAARPLRRRARPRAARRARARPCWRRRRPATLLHASARIELGIARLRLGRPRPGARRARRPRSPSPPRPERCAWPIAPARARRRERWLAQPQPSGQPSLVASMSRRTFAIGAACAGGFLAFLDTTIVNTAFPGIAASFPDATATGSRGCWTPTSS